MNQPLNNTLNNPTLKNNNPSYPLSAAQVEAFGKAVDQIRLEVMQSLNKEDADYIYKVRRFVRGSEFSARGMLAVAGWVPPVWLVATLMLAVSKIVNNMELGHNIMHGQYDWVNDESIKGQNFDWDTVCSAHDWREYHNHTHHTYTNIIGKDRDVGYTLVRVTDQQPWKFNDLFNIPKAIGLALLFEWGVGVHNLHQEDLFSGKMTLKQFNQRARPFYKKASKQLGKDYVLFPLLSTINFVPALLGNLTANVLRNLWTFAIIFCGHFTEHSEFFEDITDKETRGDWFIRQIKGSSNITGGKLFHFLSGNLSHQIEHHLFPDMPANRYQQVAPAIEALCQQYGIYYNKGRFSTQFLQVVKRIVVHSLPNGFGQRKAPKHTLA